MYFVCLVISILMRYILAVLAVIIVFTDNISAQSILHFRESRPYSVFSFLEAASGSSPHSVTYERYLDTAINKADPVFASIIDEFSNLQLSYHYSREEFPHNRRQTRSTYDLIVIAAVKSTTMDEFRINTIGILPNQTHEALFRLLKKAEPYYERLVWKTSEKSVKDQVKGLDNYRRKASELFRSFRTFYGSSWQDDTPFNVAIFPIPVPTGSTTATPHANSLCVSVLTGRKDFIGTLGVTMHELCHVLYDEQSASFQHKLDRFFAENPSPFARIAYSFFDEALATVLGNGWAFENISGTPDTTAWYNNEYIDGFAHALYPLAKEYLLSGRTIDSSFVAKAIDLFAATYPRAAEDYSIMLNSMYLYADAEDHLERAKVKNVLGRHFQSARYNFSSPVLHEYSIRYLEEAGGPQLILVDRNQDSTIAVLTKLFPVLGTIVKDERRKNFIANFYDSRHRPIILVRVENAEVLDKAFGTLKRRKFLDEAVPVFDLE